MAYCTIAWSCWASGPRLLVGNCHSAAAIPRDQRRSSALGLRSDQTHENLIYSHYCVVVFLGSAPFLLFGLLNKKLCYYHITWCFEMCAHTKEWPNQANTCYFTDSLSWDVYSFSILVFQVEAIDWSRHRCLRVCFRWLHYLHATMSGKH